MEAIASLQIDMEFIQVSIIHDNTCKLILGPTLPKN